jgi:hypothetical protein
MDGVVNKLNVFLFLFFLFPTDSLRGGTAWGHPNSSEDKEDEVKDRSERSAVQCRDRRKRSLLCFADSRSSSECFSLEE